MRKICVVIGARPQFIKHAPVQLAAQGHFQIVSIHTGQHYDYRMSEIFFEELKIPSADYNLAVGSGAHGQQTGRMMMELEPILQTERPDFLLVYGDTNSTLAGALVSAKMQIPVVHIEAGLRSFNKAMPEEINRIITDHVSSVLFTPSKIALDNLQEEGITQNVFLAGDVMYDMIKICEQRNIISRSAFFDSYYFATIHRPYNTDHLDRLIEILHVFEKLSLPVKFAVHPRTYKLIESYIKTFLFKNIEFVEPLSYFDSINTIYNSKAVITDSGGVQKEAYMLRKKCITIRSETEWVETLQNGWNTLVFENLDSIPEIINIPTGEYVEELYGDGNASGRIINVLKTL